ncbi:MULTISPECIES: lactate 2-monooxygenase [unclassified Terrabacter]|uniref:lactate 2-monooxygenase n=1 Tax=unclassified Terrabacter TaxID=2630222 RepID=UPI0006FAD3F9|nr:MULTISPECIES: lactate 2-monooxygenase [unclassified Terrabacter]KRB43719.1 lactate 2-monooxygenase [Terrabacter sp. Root181]KRF46925.1 lactate 2-monooxygenase [Terrabacter sp. Soil810]
MPQEGIGRTVQSAIYRAGAFGHRPAVPTDGTRLEAAARKVMSKRGFAYVAGSAGSEASADANVAAFSRWCVVPRMLVDTTERDTSVELFGRRHESPFLVAPVGVLSMADDEADLAVARGAREQRVTQILSTQASVPMEDVARALGGTGHWYQLYWSSDDDLVESLVSRAEACGSDALVVTLDTAYLGWRPRDLDLGHLPFARGEGIAQYTSDPVFQRLVRQRVAAAGPTVRPRPTPAAVATLVSMSRNHPGDTRHNLTAPEPRAAVETFLDVFSRPSLTWDDLPRLRALTSLPIVLKGILHPDDARRAVEAGVDGVYVSNHGGRQVDRTVAALDALPGVVEAVREAGSSVPVIFDSGIRCGADAFVALALGATAVGIGRPHVYGLALAGADGVSEVLRNLRAELDLQLALTGCTSLADLTPERLVPAP